MPLTPGIRLGPYEIQAPLGIGGMGEVYRARDTKLNRDVAIKVLADLFARDPEWLAWFEQEAQLLASLNHPHIAQVYGFEDSAATSSTQTLRALVMELVDGPTLADRIAKGPVPLEEALPIAQQIAEALETAHARGIIHRDLKPGNVKLAAGGTVKVLDFGLAKVLDPVGARELDRSPMDSPTLASPATQSGVILGTAAYMSPEQARGQAVDKRADIWALGVVIYEMLTGRRPFEGETISDTIAAVLREDIDWRQLPAETPDELRRLLRRCLERNLKNRLHDAADARLVIADVLSAAPDVASREHSSRAKMSWPWVAAIAATVAIAGVLAAQNVLPKSPRAEAVTPTVRLAIEPPPSVVNVSFVAAAADARFIVYEAQVEGEFRLFLRRFDELESRQLAGTEGARGPFISPDGTWIGFVRNAKIYKVPSGGGDALAVCDVQGGPGAAWTDDGRIVFSRAWLSGLSVVSSDGGAPTVLTTPDPAKQEIGHWWPAVLRGRVLFTVATTGAGLNEARIALLNPLDHSYRALFPGAKAAWLPSGHIVFYRTGRYHAVPFDLSSGTVTGEPFSVLDYAQEPDPAGDWS
jgi:eukaryotic-like serine/threonine-protein kinase